MKFATNDVPLDKVEPTRSSENVLGPDREGDGTACRAGHGINSEGQSINRHGVKHSGKPTSVFPRVVDIADGDSREWKVKRDMQPCLASDFPLLIEPDVHICVLFASGQLAKAILELD